MFTKLKLKQRVSRETAGRVHRYLFDFGQGAHRIFWVGDNAFIETDCPSDVMLLHNQFPDMVEPQAAESPHSFPW